MRNARKYQKKVAFEKTTKLNLGKYYVQIVSPPKELHGVLQVDDFFIRGVRIEVSENNGLLKIGDVKAE